MLIEHTLSSRMSCGTVTPGAHVGVDADDENVGLLGREFQQPEMAGMDDVEIAGDESDAFAGPGLRADRRNLRRQWNIRHIHASSPRPDAIAGGVTAWTPARRNCSAIGFAMAGASPMKTVDPSGTAERASTSLPRNPLCCRAVSSSM